MKRESNEEKFVAELLAENDDLRDATLSRGLMLSRRKRMRRRIARAGILLFLTAVAIVLLSQHQQRASNRLNVKNVSPKINEPAVAVANSNTPIRLLTDAELLDLFKDRPVALVGPPGKQKLILFDETPN